MELNEANQYTLKYSLQRSVSQDMHVKMILVLKRCLLTFSEVISNFIISTA